MASSGTETTLFSQAETANSTGARLQAAQSNVNTFGLPLHGAANDRRWPMPDLHPFVNVLPKKRWPMPDLLSFIFNNI
jgi:hypothetical protein